MNEYLNAAMIVIAVMTVYIVGGYILLSKMGFAQRREFTVLDKKLYELLSMYRDWQIVRPTDRVFIEAGGKYSMYFEYVLNPSFCLTARTNKMGGNLHRAIRRKI